MLTTGKYIRHQDGRIESCHDLIEWANWFETADRTIARTEISEEIFVSTVFLGMDHGFSLEGNIPILFETMVFGSGLEREQERYVTEEDALDGHHKWVKRVKASRGEPGSMP